MVEAVLREVDRGVPVTQVRATRGKWLRAEPVAALYAQGRVRHVGALPELEDEMCDFGPDGLRRGRSPDRLDALVWALTALMLGPQGSQGSGGCEGVSSEGERSGAVKQHGTTPACLSPQATRSGERGG